MSIPRCLLILSAFTATLACSHAPWNPHRGWSVYRTGNVELYSDALIAPTLALNYLDASYEVLSRTLFRDGQIPPVRAMHVSNSKTSPLTNADGSGRTFAAVARLPGAGGEQRSLLLVGETGQISHYAHVVAHHFIQTAVPDAPLWLHEGLAYYFSRFRKEPSDLTILCFGNLQPAEASYVVEPLEKLFSVGWAEYNETMAPNIEGTAWGFVDYLMHGEAGRLRDRLQPLIRELATGASTKSALAKVYPELALDALDKRFRDHMRTQRPNELCPMSVKLGPGFGRKHPAANSPVPEADIKALLDSLKAMPVRRGFADYFPS